MGTHAERRRPLLDEFARTAGLPSRSAAEQYAIRLLRLPDREQDYAAAQ